MQVSVEVPNKLERRLTVSVPFQTVDEAFDKRISKLAKTAKVNGFRMGKVPLEVIRQRFGDSVRQEALSEVIQSTLYAAMQQEKLTPVGVPTVQPKTVMPGQPLEYIAMFEVMPVIETVNFNVDKLEKLIAKVTDPDIEKVIEKLCEQYTTWNTVNRPAQDKDKVFVDFSGSIEGKVFPNGQAHDYPIVIGSKMMIPGFEEGILGMKTGEEKVLSITFPENYFAKEVAGKVAEFTIKAIKIMEPKAPELNAALIKKLGVKSGDLNELRAEIRSNLERELERVIKHKLKVQIFDKLLEQNKLELPKALIEREAKRIHDQVHPHHGHEHHHSEAEMQQFNEAAAKQVTVGLLVAELVKKHQLTVTKERLEAYVETLAAAYEKPEEVKKWYLSDKRQRAEIEMQVLEELVTEKLLEGIKVTEKLSTYAELMK